MGTRWNACSILKMLWLWRSISIRAGQDYPAACSEFQARLPDDDCPSEHRASGRCPTPAVARIACAVREASAVHSGERGARGIVGSGS